MKLWTWQTGEFSLISGNVDWQKSGFYQQNLGKIRESYSRLQAAVSTSQIIWCCISSDDWPCKAGYIEWELEVPRKEILAIVDQGIWVHRWCGLNSGISSTLRDRFIAECLEESQDYLNCLETKTHEYINRDGPLLLNDVSDAPAVNVLLRHPISSAWIHRRISRT